MSLHPTSKPDTCYGGGVLLYRRIEGLLRRVRAYFALSTSPAPLRLLISSRRKPGVAIVKIRATGDEVEVRGQSTDREVLLEIFGAETWELPFEPARKPRWVIDAGANVGYASIYFARKFPTAMVIALEPEPNNFSQLVRNTSIIPNIRPVQAALWSADCEPVPVFCCHAVNYLVSMKFQRALPRIYTEPERSRGTNLMRYS